MRRKTSIHAAVAGIVLCLIVLLPGCHSGETQGDSSHTLVKIDANEPTQPSDSLPSEESHPPAESQVDVDWVLKFVPGRTVTYTAISETERAVQWEGDVSNKPAAFQGGAIGNHVELTFEQRVDRIKDEGNAVLEVTILAVKYFGQSRETVVLDFDSSRDRDQASPLSKLIGQHYDVEMTPKGAVVSIDGVAGIRDLVRGTSPDHQVALKLISDKDIRERHEVPALTASEGQVVRPGGTWSNVTMISFGRMGAKAYERLYTLDRIGTDAGDCIAHVTMEGIPSSAAAKQLHESQNDMIPTGMVDNVDSYEGQFQFDLDAGRIDTSAEQFRTEWVVVDQAAVQSGAAHPSAVRMTMTQSYKLERVK